MVVDPHKTNLVGGALAISLNTQLRANGTRLGMAVDAQLGTAGHFDVMEDKQSRAQRSMFLGSIFAPSVFLPSFSILVSSSGEIPWWYLLT